eukprot:s2453_g11.t1
MVMVGYAAGLLTVWPNLRTPKVPQAARSAFNGLVRACRFTGGEQIDLVDSVEEARDAYEQLYVITSGNQNIVALKSIWNCAGATPQKPMSFLQNAYGETSLVSQISTYPRKGSSSWVMKFSKEQLITLHPIRT